jgi:hypothetical protein
MTGKAFSAPLEAIWDFWIKRLQFLVMSVSEYVRIGFANDLKKSTVFTFSYILLQLFTFFKG